MEAHTIEHLGQCLTFVVGVLAWVIQDGTEGRQVTCVHRTQPNLHAGMRRTYVRYEVIGIEAGRARQGNGEALKRAVEVASHEVLG